PPDIDDAMLKGTGDGMTSSAAAAVGLPKPVIQINPPSPPHTLVPSAMSSSSSTPSRIGGNDGVGETEAAVPRYKDKGKGEETEPLLDASSLSSSETTSIAQLPTPASTPSPSSTPTPTTPATPSKRLPPKDPDALGDLADGDLESVHGEEGNNPTTLAKRDWGYDVLVERLVAVWAFVLDTVLLGRKLTRVLWREYRANLWILMVQNQTLVTSYQQSQAHYAALGPAVRSTDVVDGSAPGDA
ncbi:hypothetical protein HK102_012915, partial [Quaeritorhiza haematococci]